MQFEPHFGNESLKKHPIIGFLIWKIPEHFWTLFTNTTNPNKYILHYYYICETNKCHFKNCTKESFTKDPGDTALADVMAPGVMAATYGLVWTLVLADITKGLATNRYHSIYTSSI